MFENLINPILVWQKGLVIKDEQRKPRLVLSGFEDALVAGPCRLKVQTPRHMSIMLINDY